MNYYQERENRAEDTVKSLSNSLPPVCAYWLKDRSAIKTATSAVSYARTMLLFFKNYASRHTIEKPTHDFTVEDIERISKDDIELFLSDIVSYQANSGHTLENSPESIRSKLSTIRSFFSYLVNNQYIEKHPLLSSDKASVDRFSQPPIVTCDMDDIQKFLDVIISPGEALKKESFSQKYSIYEHERLRDIAMMKVLISTGISLSNMVSLDVDDFDADRFVLSVYDASGDKEEFFLKDPTGQSLYDYLYGNAIGCRTDFAPISGEQAIFISRKTHKRISVRTVQYIMKEYSALAFKDGRIITPRMIRKTVKKDNVVNLVITTF